MLQPAASIRMQAQRKSRRKFEMAGRGMNDCCVRKNGTVEVPFIPLVQFSLHCGEAGLDALLVLIAGDTAGAHAADYLAVQENRHAAG